MAFNVNELILDRVRSATAHDLGTGEMLFRLTSIEDPNLNTTAEGEEVTDAVGALITTLYRSKRGEFTGTNSLVSLDLLANQYGTKKEIGGDDNKIVDYTYEILDVKTANETVKLAHTPLNHEDVKFAYSVVSGEVGQSFKAGSAASATEFVISEAGEITPPTDFTGKLYVDYQFENTNANRVVNSATKFPEACKLVIYVYFRDKCNENILYSGKIICPKAKINPESIELALTSTGKHPFTFTMMKDYCAEEGEDELFSVIVSE